MIFNGKKKSNLVMYGLNVCQVALSTKAEQVLEAIVQKNTKGDVIYFWAKLDMNGGYLGSSDVLTFWSMCDILNGGNCR